MTLDVLLDEAWILCEILPNLINYAKFHLRPRNVIWINYANKGVCGSILGMHVKRNIEY